MSGRGRVAVVGAGIAGLGVTIALRRVGFEVVTYERAEVLGSVGAVVGVHSNAVLALRALGAADLVVAAGEEVRRWELRSWRGRCLAAWSQEVVSRALGAPGLTVPRAALQRALLNAAGPDTLRMGSQLVGGRQTDSCVELRFADGSRDRVDLLVGADGLGSVTRGLLHGEEWPRYAGFVAWRAIADHSVEWPVGLARQTLGRGATFGCWPLADGRLYWVATLAGRDGGVGAPEAQRRRLVASFGSAHWPVPDLIRSTSPDVILRTPIYHRASPASWHRGRIVLVGDAAHAMVPTTGQGGGQALLDALALAEALGQVVDLSDGVVVRQALGAYERVRRPVVTVAAAEARRLGEWHHVRNPVKRLMRDRALRRTPEQEWIRRMSDRARVPAGVGGL